MKEIQKGMSYDMHTDANYDAPECPACGMPLFGLSMQDIGDTVKCSCGEELRAPDYEWIRKYIKDNTGETIRETKCFQCGGSVRTTLRKINGHWRTAYGVCNSCGMRFIV